MNCKSTDVYPAFYGHRYWTASDASRGHPAHGYYNRRYNKKTGALLIPEAWAGFLQTAKNRIHWLEAHKKKYPSKFIVDNRFTMVDIQVWCTLYFYANAPPGQDILEEAELKNSLPWTSDWFDRIGERPATEAMLDNTMESSHF